MILSDQSIFMRPHLISPFSARQTFGGMSYGLSSCGYDVRVGETVHVSNDGKVVLGVTLERFSLPDDLLMQVVDKSSWARRGLFVQNTVAEPGWCGYLTLELTNNGHVDLLIEEGMPIAQVIFHLLDQPTSQPYKGKYQDAVRVAQPAIDE